MTATADWIDDLERKAKAATPGPWSADGYGSGQQVTGATGTIFADTHATHKDAKFIAAANPAAILRLIWQLRGEERKARGFAYDLRIAEAFSDKRAQEIDRLIEENRRMRQGSLCPECNAKAWGERADLRRERDELAARLATVENLADEIVKALADAGLLAAVYISPDDTTKEN